MNTEGRSGYQGSFDFGNTKALEDYYAISSNAIGSAPSGQAVASRTSAAILSSLAHANSKAAVAKTSAAYARAVGSGFGMGGLYYGTGASAALAQEGQLTFASAISEGKARDLSSLSTMSLREAARASLGASALEGILSGSTALFAELDERDALAAEENADLSGVLDARSKWMLSMISPSANALGAACLLADLEGALEGSDGTLPMAPGDAVIAYPDLGEARLRDEDMVMGKLGLVPDIIGDTLNGTQAVSPALLLDDAFASLATMDVAAGDEAEAPPVVDETEPLTPPLAEKPADGEEPVTPPVAEEPTDEEKPVTPPVAEEPATPKSYIINYDANGGKICDGSSSLKATIVTDGANDVLSSADAVSKDGYTFLCWNTKANGSGIAIKGKCAVSSKNLRDMIYDKDLDSRHGADTTLYAQWVPNAVSDPNDPPSATTPVEPPAAGDDEPAIVEQPSQADSSGTRVPYPGEIFASSNADSSHASAPAAQSLRSSIAMAATVPLIAAVSGAGDIVGAVAEFLMNPPTINALQVSPVSSTQLVTLTSDQIAGTGDGQGGLGDLSTADATVVAGAVVAAVSIAGITAAVSGSVAASAAQSAVISSAATSAYAGVAGAASGAAGAAAADAAAEIAALAAVANKRRVRRFRRSHSVNQ